MILNFKQFNESSSEFRMTAGVAIKYMNNILLIHPSNSSWHKNTLGIPKGKIEKGEDPIEAAIRETQEETGILINPNQLIGSEMLECYRYDKEGKATGQLLYFNMEISDLSEIGLYDVKVPKEQLQLKEVDWAGFVPISDAYSLIERFQMIILDRLS
jgi:8-oxo-dGTP pyrophosphatase MutT (NUDIX family)